jgi:hypothetical protein
MANPTYWFLLLRMLNFEMAEAIFDLLLFSFTLYLE